MELDQIIVSMIGPSSSLDNQMLRFDETTGHKVQVAPLTHFTDTGQMSLGQVAVPCSILELWDDDAHPILSITAAHATDYDPQIQFRTDVSDTVKFSMGVDGADDKFKIFSGAGIGDTTEFVMDTNGGIKCQNAANSTTAYQWLDADGGAPILNIDTTNERVGIGTDAPISKIHLQGNSADFFITQADGKYSFGLQSNANGVGIFNLWDDNPDSDSIDAKIHFTSASGSDNWINNGGNLGIGISVPLHPLHLSLSGDYFSITDSGDSDTDRVRVGESSGNGGYLNLYDDSETRTVFIRSYAASGVQAYFLAGNIGIGEVSPETLFEMTSTVPYMTFHNSTEENGADGRESKLIFKGEKLDTSEHTMCIQTVAKDGSGDDQKAYISWALNDGSDGDSPTERMRVSSDGSVEIVGEVDVISGGNSLVLGGDNALEQRTDNTNKYSRIGGAHYINAEEPVGFLLSLSSNTENILAWGGGSSVANAATKHSFYTAGDTTTVTGTEVFTIKGSKIGLGVTNPLAGGMEIYKDLGAPTDLGDFDNYQLVVRGGGSTGDYAGILIGSSADTYGGSAIVHYDTGGGGQGDLVFYVKQGTGAVPPVECLRMYRDGNIGINETAPDAQLEVKSSAAGVTALHLKAAASPTANIFNITDSDDNSLVRVTSGGKIQGEVGIRTSANDWGDGLSTWPCGLFVAEHTISDNKGNFDATGNANGEAYFYDTTNSPFTQADVDNRNWINITSGTFKGAKAEIIEYISADAVLIHAHGTCWDEDLSNENFKIYPAPQFITSDCFDTHLHVGQEGQFHVENSGGLYTGHAGMCMDFEIGADDSDAFHIHLNAGGHNNVDAIQIFYETGDLQAGDQSQIMQITVDETGATGGEVDCIYLETTDAAAGVEKHGIHIGTGFDVALEVSGGSAINPDYGYETTSGASTDRVNSAGAGDDAFINAAVDVELFDSSGDNILIGNDDQFEVVAMFFSIVASKDLEFTFWYSKAGGNWTQFYPNDGTQGGTKSGLINFPAPGDWTKDDEDLDGNAITDAYYMAVERTYAPNVPTLPTEDYFKIYLEQGGDTGMQILGDGSIKLPYLTAAPANLTNGRCWMENDGLHIYYGDAEKLVAGA